MTPQVRKVLIDSLTKLYDDSWQHEYVYGQPDEEHCKPIFEVVLGVMAQAVEWKAIAKQNSWKAIQAEAQNLIDLVDESIAQAKLGCDPLSQGAMMVELLNRIPGEIAKQKLGITSWKEMQKISEKI